MLAEPPSPSRFQVGSVKVALQAGYHNAKFPLVLSLSRRVNHNMAGAAEACLEFKMFIRWNQNRERQLVEALLGGEDGLSCPAINGVREKPDLQFTRTGSAV